VDGLNAAFGKAKRGLDVSAVPEGLRLADLIVFCGIKKVLVGRKLVLFTGVPAPTKPEFIMGLFVPAVEGLEIKDNRLELSIKKIPLGD
jgi:hypothetical protein